MLEKQAISNGLYSEKLVSRSWLKAQLCHALGRWDRAEEGIYREGFSSYTTCLGLTSIFFPLLASPLHSNKPIQIWACMSAHRPTCFETDIHGYWTADTNTLKQTHTDLLTDSHKAGNANMCKVMCIQDRVHLYSRLLASTEFSFILSIDYIDKIYTALILNVNSWILQVHRMLFPSLKIKSCYNYLDLLRPEKAGLRDAGCWQELNYLS